MTTDLIAMARECGAHQCSNFGHEDWFDFSREALAAFRRAIIADEAKVVEPFWHAVISDECPVVNKAIRSLEVAEEYAGKCAEHYTGVEVVGLCRASTVAALRARVEELEATVAEISGDEQEAKRTVKYLKSKASELAAQVDSKQAKIDSLMLEFCPKEMTPEQLETWAAHQKPYISPE